MPRSSTPWLILVSALLLTAVVMFVVGESATARDRARFDNAVQVSRDRVEQRLDTYVALLRGTAGLFAAEPDGVSREEFRAFVTRLQLAESYPGVQGIGFSRRVRPGEADEFVAAMRAGGVPEFTLRPDTPRAEIHAVQFLEPLDRRNRAALGFDMFSEATGREAMSRARDRGAAALSGRVTLVQEIVGPVQAGFLIYLPVYRGGVDPGAVEGRRGALEGFVYSPFRADDLFRGIFGTERRPLVAFRVYDGPRADSAALLHDSRVARVAPARSPHFQDTVQLEVAGRRWTVAFASTRAFEVAARRRFVPFIGLAGVLGSLALFGLALLQARSQERSDELAARLTDQAGELARRVNEAEQLNRELRAANQDLAEATRQAELGRERMAFLAEASRLLGEILDEEQALNAVAQLAARRIGDYCLVDLLEPDGTLRRVAVAHRDPRKHQKLLETRRFAPLPGSPLAQPLTTGEPVLFADFHAALRDRAAVSPEHRALIEALNPLTMICAPIPVRGHPAGVISYSCSIPGQRYGPDDVAVARELASRAGTAIERARMFSEQQQAEAALRESEARFRLVADSIPQLAWMADETGAITWYNRRWFEYTGTTMDQMAGWGWKAVHHPEHLDRVVERFTAAVHAGEPWEDTFPLRGADGRYRRFLSRALPLRDEEGRVVQWFGTNTDVEERLRAEEEARAARAEAEAANRAKSEFLAAMSHELRTPLNAIAGYVDLLELGVRGPVNDEQRRDLERIQRAQRHLLALINDILNFARLEAGRVEYRVGDVPVARALSDLRALTEPQVRARGLAYTERLHDPGAVVRADGEKVQQILLNLLTNAVKFTEPGGVITVEAAAEDGQICISVSDTGRGIPADRLQSIFDPFVQVDRHRTEQSQQGVGLGLAISRELARGMGGDLSVRSRSGQGSTFTLRLPSVGRATGS